MVFCFLFFFQIPVLSILRRIKQESKDHINNRRSSLKSALTDMGNFYVEIKWDFQSWGE